MGKILIWPNINYEKDIIDTLKWNRWPMRILGIWPLIYPYTTRIEKILAMCLFALCWTVLSLFLIITSIYTFSDRSIVSEKMKMMGPLACVYFTTLKYFFLVVRHKSIRRCVQILSTDWRIVQDEYHREIMIRDAEMGHLLSKFCMVLMYGGGLSYNTLLPFLSQMPDNEQNITVRSLAYLGFDIFFNLQLMPIYIFTFCLQCFTSLIVLSIGITVCCLAAMFVAHACGQIDIVLARIENLIQEEKYSRIKFQQCMAIIVQHHVRALRFSASIENTLREICLIELVEATLIMCSIEYSLITEWNNSDGIAIFSYFFLFSSFVFNIFIFCYISELLTEQCIKVGYISYKIEWYNLPGKTALDLMMMITMSRRPIQITAGRLISLSFTNFGNVLKTSIAYLNLLRTAI